MWLHRAEPPISTSIVVVSSGGVRRDIAELADPLDTELPAQFTGDGARHAHRRYWQ